MRVLAIAALWLLQATLHLAVQSTNVVTSSAYGETVTIEVGKDDAKKTFYPHKGVLYFYSGYFKAALNGSWSESESGVIKLESEDADIFGRFMLWLYTGRITDGTLQVTQTLVVDLWLFADRRNIPLLMNEMVNELHGSVADSWIVPTHCLRTIYENTSEGSALRRLLIYSVCRTYSPKDEVKKRQVDAWPQAALAEMLGYFLGIPPPTFLPKEQYKALEMCPEYHVHEEGVTCEKTA